MTGVLCYASGGLFRVSLLSLFSFGLDFCLLPAGGGLRAFRDVYDSRFLSK
jgi:hypothetical protein